MPQTNDLTLVKGDFTAKEAKEITDALLKSKITFHALKNFSSFEGFGEEDTRSVSRVKELKATKEALGKLLRLASQEGRSVTLDSKIRVTVH